MSQQRARAALRGEKTDYIPIMTMPAHKEYLAQYIGIDPVADLQAALTKAVRDIDLDILAFSLPGAIAEDEDESNLFGLGGIDWRNEESGIDDIFNHDPSSYRNWQDVTVDDWIGRHTAHLASLRQVAGEHAITTGSFFTTCFHYAAEDLNYEEFLINCMLEEEQLVPFFDRCEAQSSKVLQAWAKTPGLEMMVCHDDIANSRSLAINAPWLRRNIIPRYQRLFAPFQGLDAPLIFMSDGNYLDVAREIKDAGAKGFFIDPPCMTLADMVTECGKDMIYITGPTPDVVTNGTVNDVEDEIRMLCEQGKDLPRLLFIMPGDFAHNMPAANVDAFFKACRKHGKR